MWKVRDRFLSALTIGVILCAGLLGGASLTGCERKERIVDVETPVGDVEVDRGVDSGNVEVEVGNK